MNRRILIRTDASSQMGSGHMMRMLALGQLLSDSGYEIHFATIPHNPLILDYLKAESFQIHYIDEEVPWDDSKDVQKLFNIALPINPSWLVLDGYHFGSGYEHKIKECGFKLLRIDDIPSYHYYADIVLNQNYGAEEMAYSTEPYTQLLTGLKYVLLRREFRKCDSSSKEVMINGRFHLLITLGGLPRENDKLNSAILHGLSNISEKYLSVTFIVGKIDEKMNYLEKMAENISCPIMIKDHARNMATEMMDADFAIVSGGSTMWELMYMKVPFLAVSLTEIQRDYLKILAGEELCINLGWYEDLTPDSVRESVLGFIHDKNCRSRIRDKIKGIMDRRNIGKDLLEVLDNKS